MHSVVKSKARTGKGKLQVSTRELLPENGQEKRRHLNTLDGNGPFGVEFVGISLVALLSAILKALAVVRF